MWRCESSAADSGCLSRIRIFFYPGSRIHIKEIKYFNPKIVSKLSEIWSWLFIPDPDFLPITDPWHWHWILDLNPQHCVKMEVPTDLTLPGPGGDDLYPTRLIPLRARVRFCLWTAGLFIFSRIRIPIFALLHYFFIWRGSVGVHSIFKDFGSGKPKNYATLSRQRKFLFPNCAMERNNAFSF